MGKHKQLTKGRFYLDYENGVAHADPSCPDLRRYIELVSIGVPEKGFEMCWKCVPRAESEDDKG